MITRIARPYARALLDTVRGEQELAAHEDLLRLAEAMAAVPRLGTMAANPSIPIENKERVFGQVAATLGLGEPVRRLALLLLRNFRLSQLPSIVEAYEDLLDARRGITRAKVTSAQPLDPQQVAELERTLHRLYGREVRLELAVDPRLLGGFVVQVGSVRYDGSLEGQLRRLKDQLAAAA